MATMTTGKDNYQGVILTVIIVIKTFHFYQTARAFDFNEVIVYPIMRQKPSISLRVKFNKIGGEFCKP